MQKKELFIIYTFYLYKLIICNLLRINLVLNFDMRILQYCISFISISLEESIHKHTIVKNIFQLMIKP